MFDKVLERVATVIAAYVAREIVKQLPGIIDDAAKRAVMSLPDMADVMADRLLDRLPFPFPKRSR